VGGSEWLAGSLYQVQIARSKTRRGRDLSAPPGMRPICTSSCTSWVPGRLR